MVTRIVMRKNPQKTKTHKDLSFWKTNTSADHRKWNSHCSSGNFFVLSLRNPYLCWEAQAHTWGPAAEIRDRLLPWSWFPWVICKPRRAGAGNPVESQVWRREQGGGGEGGGWGCRQRKGRPGVSCSLPKCKGLLDEVDVFLKGSVSFVVFSKSREMAFFFKLLITLYFYFVQNNKNANRKRKET